MNNRLKSLLAIVLFWGLFFSLPQVSNAQLNTYSLMIQGQQKLSNFDYFGAIQTFNRIIESKPETQEAYFFRGICKFNLNDFKGAKSDFEHTIALNPFYSHAYHYLAITESRIGNFSKAFLLFKKGLKLSPYDAYIYFNRGVTHLQLQQYDLAINDLDSAIILRADIPEAYLSLSIALEEKDDELEALSNINKAIKLNPFLKNAYLRRALLKFKRKNFEGALVDIEQELKLDNDNPLVYYYKATINAKLNQKEAALDNFNKVLEMNPNNALVYYNRAVLKSELGQTDDAIDDFSTAIKINPQNILIYFARALELYNHKEYHKALEDLNTTIEIYPKYPKAYLLRALVFEKLDKTINANTDRLTYQKIAKESASEDLIKRDSLALETLIQFDSEFVNVEQVKNQKVQYKELDLNLSDDVFFFIRQANYHNDIYHQIDDIVLENETYQMVYYIENPLSETEIYKTIEAYENKKMNYFNYFILGTCYGLINDFNNAQEMLSRSIGLNPKFALSYANRAYFNSKLNDYLMEINERNYQSLSIDGKTASHHSQPANSSQIENNEILKDLLKAQALNPDVTIQFNLANAYAINQDFVDALYWYNQILDDSPNLKWAYFNKALILIRIHDPERACLSLSKAGELGIEEAYPLIKKFCK